MATETWNSGIGNWNDPSRWSPARVPQAGDTANLEGGTVAIGGVDAAAIKINDDWNRSAVAQGDFAALDQDATLDISDSVLGDISLIGGNPVTIHGTARAVFNIHGVAVFQGTMAPVNGGEGAELNIALATGSVLINQGLWDFGAGQLTTIDMSPGSLILNQGTMVFGPGTLTIAGDQHSDLLVNLGTIALEGNAVIEPSVIGHGTVEMGGSFLIGQTNDIAFKGYVGAGETLQFMPPLAGTASERLVIDQPREFLATIAGFGAGDAVVLQGVTASSEQFRNGVLTLYDGHHPAAALHFAGSYTAGDFAVASSSGATLIQHGA
jgi:hypothetical protein